MPATKNIRILFYTDDADESWTPIDANKPAVKDTHDDSAHRYGEHEFGLGILKMLLENHHKTSGFSGIKYEVDVVNRNYEYDKNGYVSKLLDESSLNLITDTLLADYTQIWIFGMHYGNNLPIAPNNQAAIQRVGDADWTKRTKQEFSAKELALLAKWMDAGNGVLITGDHSNPVGNQWLNLGRALGKDIKRASQLRLWQDGPLLGGPTHVDTTVGGSPTADMALMPLQEDGTPQNISFQAGAGFIGNPVTPHMLFQSAKTGYNSTGVIRHLPDHTHEGAVNVPQTLNQVDAAGKAIWPSRNGAQPKPEVVAWGINHNTNQAFMPWLNKVGLVLAYDGNSAGVGNIVAHSTWHHFVNVNLVGFMNGKTPSDTLLKISDYYANLAVYLDNPYQFRLPNIIWKNHWPFKWWPDPEIHPNWRNDLLKHANTGKNPLTSPLQYSYEIGNRLITQLAQDINPRHLTHMLNSLHAAQADTASTAKLASQAWLGELVLTLHDSAKKEDLRLDSTHFKKLNRTINNRLLQLNQEALEQQLNGIKLQKNST